MNDLAALEAILFVAEDPIPLSELAEVLELPKRQVGELIDQLSAEMSARDAGIVLREVGGGRRLFTRPEAYPYLERFSSSARSRRLSSAALETLAVVAYRQPVSRGQINEIRGVDSDSAVRTLERLGFVEEADRLDTPGHPVVYSTTPLFLEKLGLNDLSELPPLADHVPPSSVVDSLEAGLRPDS